MSSRGAGAVGAAAGQKKRKPSFRPASTRKSKKQPVVAAAGASVANDNGDEPETNPGIDADKEAATAAFAEQKSNEDNDEPSSSNKKQAAAAPPAVASNIRTKPTTKGRPRKRKTTVLAIGSSRKKAATSTALVHVPDQPSLEEQEQSSILVPGATASTALAAVPPQPDASTSPKDGEANISPSQPGQQFGTAASSSDSNNIQQSPRKKHMPLELMPPVIPQNTSGKPSLKAFCSAFPKPKTAKRGRRKKSNNINNNAEAPAADAAANNNNNPPSSSTDPNPPAPPAAPAAASQQPTVQIVNGEIVLQENSVVFQGVGALQNPGNAADMTVVEEEAEMAVVGASYSSFATGKRASRAQHWSVAETHLFYEALRQVGVDFGCMETYFETAAAANAAGDIRIRHRRQLKNKYAAELKRNPQLVERALQPAGRVGIDLSVFELTPEKVEEMAAQQQQKERQEKEAEEAKRRQEEEAAAAAKDALDEDNGVLDETSHADETDEANMDDDNAKQPATKKSAKDNGLWPDDDVGENSNGNEDEDEVLDDPGFAEDEDPLLQEDADEEHAGEAPALALVHTTTEPTATAIKKKAAKPNFRAARKSKSNKKK